MSTAFLSSLLSKKLAVAAASEALIHSLHMSADAKGFCTALVGIAFLVTQAYVDAHAKPAPTPDPLPPPAPAPEPKP